MVHPGRAGTESCEIKVESAEKLVSEEDGSHSLMTPVTGRGAQPHNPPSQRLDEQLEPKPLMDSRVFRSSHDQY